VTALLSPSFLRYGLVGGLTLVVYLLAGSAFQYLALSLVLAANLAFALAVAVNYLLQRFWVFAGRRSARDSLPRYAVMIAVGGTLNSLALAALCSLMPLFLAQVLTAILIVVSNALLAFLWVFPARLKS